MAPPSATAPTPKIDSKGVEKNRLDNTPLIRKMMTRVFEFLLIDGDVQGALKYVHQRAVDLIQGKVKFSDLVLTKSISKPAYKSKTAHVEVAARMKARDPSYLVAPGERIPYVIVKTDRGKCVGGAKVFDKAEDPLWSIQHDMEIDVDHYIQDISKPLARTLMWYIAPVEMLEQVRSLEDQIARAIENKHTAEEEELEKTLKKQLQKMTMYVANQILGPGALLSIPRPAPKHVGPIFKFLAPAAKKSRKTPADEQHLEMLRAKLLEAKAKCVKCRGREDDTVDCVQRDCSNLFKIAILTRDIEDIVK